MTKLLVEESPLVLSPSLASAIGLCEAVVLQQIHYWLNSNSGQIIDGIRWIYNRLDDWLQQFPWLSKWQLRVVMKRLRDELKVLKFAQHEKQQYKRRGWYTIDYEMLNNLLHTSKCDMSTLRDESSSHLKVSDFHTSEEQEITPEKTSVFPQQDTAAVRENDLEEVDWDTLENQVARWEEEQLTSEQPVVEELVMLASNQEESDQTTDTLYVDEPEQVNSLEKPIIHEGNSSAPKQIIPHRVLHVPETASPITSDTREDNTDQQNKGWLSLAGTMRQEEIRSVYNELRQISCTPAFKLNETVQSVVRKYWENVPGAIAYLKEALRTWKRVESPEKVFVVACKEGRKPESGAVMKSGVTQWYEWARKQRLVIGGHLDKGIVYGLDGEILKLEDMMAKYPNASASLYCVAEPQAAEIEC